MLFLLKTRLKQRSQTQDKGAFVCQLSVNQGLAVLMSWALELTTPSTCIECRMAKEYEYSNKCPICWKACEIVPCMIIYTRLHELRLPHTGVLSVIQFSWGWGGGASESIKNRNIYRDRWSDRVTQVEINREKHQTDGQTDRQTSLTYMILIFSVYQFFLPLPNAPSVPSSSSLDLALTRNKQQQNVREKC